MIASGVTQIDTYLVRFSAGLRVRVNDNLWYLMTSGFKDKELDTEFELLDQTQIIHIGWKSSLLMLMCLPKNPYQGEFVQLPT